MIEWKAYHLALQAWARADIPGTLELYGEGPSRERLQGLAVELGVADSVRFPGNVSRSEPFAALSRAHAFVHPSLHDSGDSPSWNRCNTEFPSFDGITRVRAR